jgi:hypothetical protein
VPQGLSTSQKQAQHVTEIVSGVGKQRHRVGEHSGDGFHNNEADVERRPEREGKAEILRRVVMSAHFAAVIVAATGMRIGRATWLVPIWIPRHAHM